jgi:hypothetical protein
VTDTNPTHIATRRRRITNAALRVIDTAVGIAAFAAGVFALVATPPTILREVQWPWLVFVWAGLLILGGAALAFGRITGIWLFETTGIAAAAFGLAIYVVVVSTAIPREPGVLVATVLLFLGLLLMGRRYVELQEFTSEWGRLGPVERMQEALRVRHRRARTAAALTRSSRR